MTNRHIPKTYPYAHVDAFARTPFSGNQAAVIELDHWPEDAILQAIGAENNFAETAFLLPLAKDAPTDVPINNAADYELRWFTPKVEIALFCGHATLASGHYALNIRQGGDQHQIVRFKTRNAGILTVARDPQAPDNLTLSLPAYRAEPAPMPDWVSLLSGDPPSQYLFYPGDYHLLLFDRAEQVTALTPDFRALADRLGDAQFICTAPGTGHRADTDVISRIFVPGAGVDEDSVTGSAHALLTVYWAERLERPSFSAYQASQRGGFLNCNHDRENGRAILAGPSQTIATGKFYI